MNRTQRTLMREAHEKAEEAYARDLALYETETERWNAAWRAAGKEPPPTSRVKPTQPKANWGTCRDCAGFGLDFHEEYCRECGGTGDAPRVARRVASIRRRRRRGRFAP